MQREASRKKNMGLDYQQANSTSYLLKKDMYGRNTYNLDEKSTNNNTTRLSSAFDTTQIQAKYKPRERKLQMPPGFENTSYEGNTRQSLDS